MPFLVHLILYHIDTDTKIIADNGLHVFTRNKNKIQLL